MVLSATIAFSAVKLFIYRISLGTGTTAPAAAFVVQQNLFLDVATSNKANDTNNMQQLSSTAKNHQTAACRPLLIEHVGPMKTATTTLQTAILGNRKWKKILASDGIEVLDSWDHRKMGSFQRKCLEGEVSRRNCSSWGGHVELYKKQLVRIQQESSHCNTKVIHSSEAFSAFANIGNRPLAKHLFKSLWEGWDVVVLLSYRRFDEWLISLYAQVRKVNIIIFISLICSAHLTSGCSLVKKVWFSKRAYVL